MRVLSLSLCIASVSAYVVRRIHRANVDVESKATTASSGGTPKKALLIHSGVMRNYKHLWPMWEKNFIKPSEAAGVQFTIGVSTDLHSHCDPDDPDAYQEGLQRKVGWNKNRCACASHAPSEECGGFSKSASEAEKARFTREIQAIYGPSSKGGPVHVVHRVIADLPQKHFNSVYTRARPILEMYENNTFDYIIVTRPDIVLVDTNAEKTWTTPEKDTELNLVSICNTHPGLNIISGFFKRNDDVHYRDWDWGYMLCDGKRIQDAKAVIFEDSGGCSKKNRPYQNGKCVPPARDAAFASQGKNTFDCNSRACSWWEGMEGKMRFGTLDDAVFGFWRGKRM